MPKISIIMGVYNVQNYDELQRSIESIINQSYKEWEFIICDDGSTNETKERMEEIAKQDSRIKIVGYKKNKGLGNALNECVKVSKGEYIARQDADDYSAPLRLETELKFLEMHPEISFVCCNAAVYSNEGIWGEHVRPERPTKKDFLFRSQFLHPTLLIRKSDLNAVHNYRVIPETKKAEDYDLFMRLYAAGYEGYNIQEKLYYYKVEVGNGQYRTLADRVDEAKVRKYCFKKMGFGITAFPYVVKPIILGLLPRKVFKTIRKKGFK